MWQETADRRLKAAVQLPDRPRAPPGPLDGLYGDPTSDVSVRNRAGFGVSRGGESLKRRPRSLGAQALDVRRSTYPLQLARSRAGRSSGAAGQGRGVPGHALDAAAGSVT